MKLDSDNCTYIIVHHSEIALKKGNRDYFEDKLRKNIRASLKDMDGISLKIDFGRFFLKVNENAKVELIIKRLKNVIGIAHLRVAFAGHTDVNILKEQVFEKVKNLSFTSFRINTKRADKQFPFNSVQVNQIVGEPIHKLMNKRVDLKNADLEVIIEIFNKRVYYSVEAFAGERGLPVGSTGKVVSLLSSGIDSPVSTYKMLKRGCKVVFVHFHSFPFTEKNSYYNALQLAKKLTVYQNSSKIYFVPLGKIQQEIILNAPAKLRVILYRRMMFRLAERIALKERARALVTGESLGQVASQTLENIAAISSVVSIPIFRPLIGMEKEEIIKIARQIGTFITSTEPYDDCCSYLIPEKPETRAKPDQVLEAEEKLTNWEQLVEQALNETEKESIYFPESYNNIAQITPSEVLK